MNPNQRDFDNLWATLMKPVRKLQQQVTDINRQAARSEVAGAVEVVAALPSAGEKGRLLFLSTDNQMYFDNGTVWIPMGGTGYETVTARASGTPGPTLSDGVATIVNFNTVDFDTHSAITTGSSWKFTAPMDGFYQVNARIMLQGASSWQDPEALVLFLYKNGSEFATISRQASNPNVANYHASVWGADIVDLDKDEFINIVVQQNSGSNQTLNTAASHNYVSIARVGEYV